MNFIRRILKWIALAFAALLLGVGVPCLLLAYQGTKGTNPSVEVSVNASAAGTHIWLMQPHRRGGTKGGIQKRKTG